MKSLTSSSLAMTIVSIGLVAATAIRIEAQLPSKSSPSKVVVGEVSRVEGEFLMEKTPQGEDALDIVDKSIVITDQAGKQMRLMLDNNTKVEQWVNPGDRIEAKISSEGHTLSVTRLER